MKPLKRLLGGTFAGVLVSTMVHVAMGGALYYGFLRPSSAPIVAELDLSMTPMGPAAGGGKPTQEWLIPQKNKKTPPPPPPSVQEPAPTLEEVKAEEDSGCAAGTDCSGEGSGAGSGEGDGGFIDAADAARKPRWIKNFITSADYPRLARQQGKDGRVVIQVLLDDAGRVADVRLLEGAYEALNEVALRKVRHAVFTPAYNAQGQAVACRMILPIRFELR